MHKRKRDVDTHMRYRIHNMRRCMERADAEAVDSAETATATAAAA